MRKEPKTFSTLNVKCRGLTNTELKTQIVDFDIERGITYCEIYKKTNPDFIMSTDADAFWVLHNSGETQNIQGLTKIQGKTSNIGKSTGNSSSGDTFSTFLVKTVLLMNSSGSKGTNVTEFDASDFTAQWNNSDGFMDTAKSMGQALWQNIQKPVKYIASKLGVDTQIATKDLKVPYVASASDGFDEYNFAYYRTLFNAMNEVYVHLQNLLFIVVGGFFLPR